MVRCPKHLPDVVSGRCYRCGELYRPRELPYELVHGDGVRERAQDPTKDPDYALDPTEVAR